MKISTRGRYALRVMIDLAQCDGSKYISLKEISQRQEISMKYLEMITAILNKAGFVLSLRGKSGGYKLARKPDEYTVGAILRLTEGSLAPVACLDCKINTCSRADNCITLPMWKNLEKLVNSYLDGITISDLINNDPDSFNGCNI